MNDDRLIYIPDAIRSLETIIADKEWESQDAYFEKERLTYLKKLLKSGQFYEAKF